MALESASYISQLVNTNPTGADPKGQGDDHIRMLKRVLQNTFPNLNAQVDLTPAQLNVLATPNLFVQPGMIVMWSGSLASLPLGWLLCNGAGTISNGTAVPDLRNKFVIGAGGELAVNAVGGSKTYTFNGSTNAVPASVVIPATGWGATGGSPGSIQYGRLVVGSGQWEIEEGLESIRAAGGDRAINLPEHSHTWTTGAQTILPPYIALGFIIKQ